MESKILQMLMDKNEITWQSLLYNIIKNENMDPWDINVSKLAKSYIEIIKKLKELDLRISGKVVLAAAILLKIKSTKLVGENLTELDRLFSSVQEASVEEIEDFYEGLSLNFNEQSEEAKKIPRLLPRTPQPRRRKVSLQDLMNALEKALEVKERRTIRRTVSVDVKIPEKKIDITEIIKKVYSRLVSLFKVKARVTFSDLVQSDRKEDKVYTFIPLLHLAHQGERKIDLLQEKPFGEIEILLHKSITDKEIKAELGT